VTYGPRLPISRAPLLGSSVTGFFSFLLSRDGVLGKHVGEVSPSGFCVVLFDEFRELRCFFLVSVVIIICAPLVGLECLCPTLGRKGEPHFSIDSRRRVFLFICSPFSFSPRGSAVPVLRTFAPLLSARYFFWPCGLHLSFRRCFTFPKDQVPA